MRLFTWYNVVIQRKEEKFMSDFIFVVLLIAIVVTFVMAFVRLHQGEDDSLWYLISWIVLLFGTFLFLVSLAYNDKKNLYFTDVNGKSYVYKNVTHVSTGKNNIIYFTDKNGNKLQFNIASLKETEAK